MKKSYLKTNLISTRELVDIETGEIIDYNVNHHKYLANNKEEFMLLYSSILGIFEGLEQSEIRVYGYLLRYAEGLEFDISKKIRLNIAESTNLNERTVYKTCQSLVDKKLIYKNSNGLYKINPRYAFKGSTSERNAALKAILEIECPEC